MVAREKEGGGNKIKNKNKDQSILGNDALSTAKQLCFGGASCLRHLGLDNPRR